MTEEQKKLAEIQRYASGILEQEKHWKRVNLQAYAIMHLSASRIIELARAIETGGKCKWNKGTHDLFTTCNKCGYTTGRKRYDCDRFCPGCGCEIEATE